MLAQAGFLKSRVGVWSEGGASSPDEKEWKETWTYVPCGAVLLPLRVAHTEEQTFPGLHLPAKYPLPAASSDSGAG